MSRREEIAKALVGFAYFEIALENMLTVQMDGAYSALVPPHWQDDAFDRALTYADAVEGLMS